jgi:mitotic spindle assembly checkpoint protein MAD2B
VHIGSDLGGIKTVPVRAVEAGEFILETWIEEGKAKQNYET